MPSIGRYELGALLGEGGAGRVYEARRVGPGDFVQVVALKVLHTGRTALRREARIGGLLRHRHLVDVYEVGQVDGQWFCALERCAGSLADHLPLPARAVVEAGQQVCRALAYAHAELGLVHLDLKPANLLFSEAGEVKVADLGIAQAAGFEGDGRVRGTPGYMAPEQARGAPVDARADLYALGVTLVELATGTRPGATRTVALDWAGEEGATVDLDGLDPIEGSAVHGVVPDWLASAVDRCLAFSPDDRWPDMESLGRALDALEVDGPGLVQALGVAPVAAVGSGPNLGVERDRFVGRAAELSVLQARLVQPGITVLRGTAGVGKSRLAATAARQWRDRSGGEGWRIDLSEARSVEGLLFAVARALQVPLRGGEPGVQLGHALAGRGPAVFLLDSVEHLESVVEVVAAWAERATEARWLLTSRRPLSGTGEPVVVEALDEAEGVALLVARARQRGVQLEPGSELGELVGRLDGLPLALELAAGRLGVLEVTDLLDRFDLGLLRAGTSGRHGTLRAALDWSWELLSPTARSVLAQLSVFSGGGRLRDLEAVLRVDPGTVLDGLQEGVDHSLVSLDASGRVGWLRSIQAYAAGQLEEPAAVERAHGQQYARQGTPEQLARLDAHGGAVVHQLLAEDLDNAMVACRRAVARGWTEVAVGTLAAAWATMRLQGPYDTASALAREVGAMADLSVEGRVRVAWIEGSALRYAGRLDGAAEALERGLVAARAGGPELEAQLLAELAVVRHDQGRMEEAEDHYRQALAGFPEEAVADRGRVLGNLGSLATDLRRVEEAQAAYDEAVALFQRIGARRDEGVALGSLGALRFQTGDPDGAVVAYRQALQIHRDLGNRHHEGVVLGNLANVVASAGNWEDARAATLEALALHRTLGNRRSEGIALSNLGWIDSSRAAPEDALGWLGEALPVLQDIGDRHSEGLVHGNRGGILRQLGRLDAAREALRQARRMARDTRDPRLEGYWVRGLAMLEPEATDRALPLLDEAVTLLTQAGDPMLLAQALANRAEVLAVGGRWEEAEAELARAEAQAPDGFVEVTAAIERVRALLLREPGRSPGRSEGPG